MCVLNKIIFRLRRISLLAFIFLVFGVSQAQEVRIFGKISDENGFSDFSNLFVVNQRTRTGNYAEPTGYFDIRIQKNDTLIIGATGFATYRFSVSDSVLKETYEINICLKKLEVNLPTAQVFAPRDLKRIYDDIEKLGFRKEDYMITGVDAFSNPITALYIAFSRKEQKKIEAFRLINEDKKRELLKELFQKYVDFRIIDLENDLFDDFIDFCNVPDEFIKSATQYEFIEFIKVKYRMFDKMTRFDDYERY